MKAGWWDAPLALRDLAEAISITRSKISYSLVEPQSLLFVPACGYEFHALAVHAHPTFTAPPARSHLEFGRGSVVKLFRENSLRAKAVGCFRRGTPSLMFDGILNVTLSKDKVSTTGVTQRNLELLLRPNFPDSYQTQIQEYKILDWPHVLISLKENSFTW